jgi:hypothetical protein
MSLGSEQLRAAALMACRRNSDDRVFPLTGAPVLAIGRSPSAAAPY